ncbi:MAG: hypothetical protein Q4B66_00020, partial [Ligilactobacillus agilis]|nr:hypothetical protein [Ligilactobacillus agilis]
YHIDEYEILNSPKYQSKYHFEDDKIVGNDYRRYLIVTMTITADEKQNSYDDYERTYDLNEFLIVNGVTHSNRLTKRELPTKLAKDLAFKDVNLSDDDDHKLNPGKSKTIKIAYPIYSQDDAYLVDYYGSSKKHFVVNAIKSKDGITADEPMGGQS